MLSAFHCQSRLFAPLSKKLVKETKHFSILNTSFSKIIETKVPVSTQLTAAVSTVNKLQQSHLVFKPASNFCIFGRYYSSDIKEKMIKHNVVPDVISCEPKETIKVTYADCVEVCMGNVLTPTMVKDQPKVVWNADCESYYTLCMTDPDAPSRENPEFREWHHWLVGNIKGNDISTGEVLSAYIGSGPPEKTGLHRYVFLVYKQGRKLEFDEKRLPDNSGDGRGKFKIANFARKYALGDPIAGNFYQAEWDDYVPILYKKLGA